MKANQTGTFNTRRTEPKLIITLRSAQPWYIRLWFIVSNPFRYLITGEYKI